MFGSSNNSNDGQQVNPPAGPTNDGALNSFTMDQPQHDPANPGMGMPPEPTASPMDNASSAPHVDESVTPMGGPSTINDQAPADLPTTMAPSSDNPPIDSNPVSNSVDDANDLLDIKQQALSQLSPIVGHLDQGPEEKFKTIMMMIQASDNQALIKDAYAAAQEITDEKAKSQALLDVVNEINYFTQKKPEQS